jgi:hypothetical protein
MRLYMMSKGNKTMVPKHKTMCGCQSKGGYVPLMLGVHHGAGASIPVPKPVDMSRAKSILGGLTLQDRKKKYISI